MDISKLEFKDKKVYLVFGVAFLFIATIINPIAGFMAACGCGLLIRYVLEKFSLKTLVAQQEVIKAALEAQKQQEVDSK